MAVSKSGNRLYICPVCCRRVSSDAKICLNHNPYKGGKEIIPLVTPQES